VSFHLLVASVGLYSVLTFDVAQADSRDRNPLGARRR